MTAPQARVLRAVADIERETGGWPVTVEAVAARVGLASRSTAHEHLRALVRLGNVERSPYAKGGYRIRPQAQVAA